MLSYIFALVFAVIACSAITLRKTYRLIPAKELKRKAKAGDNFAGLVWRAVSYGESLDLLLWFIVAVSSAASFVLFSRVAPPVFGLLAVILVVLLAFAWLPKSQLTTLGVKLTALLTPAVLWLVSILQPTLQHLAGFTKKHIPNSTHTGLFEHKDLVELLEQQKQQPDNRIPPEELELLRTVLKFGDQKVRDIVIPRAQVVSVSANDIISPVYLDELHQTLHGRFPVVGDTPEMFVGTLYLRDLTDVSKGKGVMGQVSDHMSPHVIYVHESDSLFDALQAFYLTKKQLFIVVNSFEEYVGIITIEDILHALVGRPSEYDFDQHDSKSSVARRHQKKPKPIDDVIDSAELEAPAPPTIPETDDKVVE